ncbi:MAG: hypothetical protein LAO55_16795 [Acidobacteriia bacterium]|nr:hypothetical protein [Terriglobia bacterium]
MKFFSIVAGLLLVCVSMVAHDVDGKWAGTMSTPNGDVPVNFTFKADGATLTGSTGGPDGGEVKIADGKIDGNNLSFSITFDFGGMPLMIAYKGVMSGAEIKFVLDIFGMPLDLTVKKST